MHSPGAKAFLEAGIHVICDKPLTTTLRRRRSSRELAGEAAPGLRPHPQLYRLSAGAAGARRWSQAGELGKIRVVQAEYAQDWLTDPLETTGKKQADWRTDPARSGAGGASATSARTPTTSPASSPG